MYIAAARHDDIFGSDDTSEVSVSRSPAADPIDQPYSFSSTSARTRQGPNWIALGGILLAHIVMLVALVQFDVISIKAKPKPLQMTIVPIEIVPPPKMATAPQPRAKAVELPIVAPPPIVQTLVTTPPPIVTVAEAPPPPVVPNTTTAPVAAAGLAPGPVSMGKMAQMPNNPPLKYPMSAKMRHEEGVVRLRIQVGTDGRVADIALAQSSGFDALDKAAMDVVRKWRFVPPTRDGVPVEGIGIFPATFKLA